MKKIDFKILIITSIVCLLPIALGLAVYNELPNIITTHWSIDNTPNGFMPKAVFVFALPIFMFLMQAFLCVITDVFDKYKEVNKKATSVCKWIIPIITVILYIATITYALGNMVDIRKVAMLMVGIMLIVIGNYIPKTKGHNFLNIGVVMSDELYNKSRKPVAYTMILNGFLSIISIAFNPVVSAAVIISFILEMLGIMIYMWRKSK